MTVDDLTRLIARDEIRQLACRYAYAVDHRDLDLLVSLFVPDVQVGRDAVGRDALREFFDAQLRRHGVSILHVGNHVVDVDTADSARGVVYCIARMEVEGRWVEQAIRYRDEYARRDGRWLFVRRDHRLWYGVALPYQPLEQSEADWRASLTGRGTVPHDTESWRAFWD